MPAIPDRWIPYRACGDVIEGTRFICFKVPLRKSVQSGIRHIKEIWDIPALLNKVPKLGAVIDLTNTARYYDPAEFQAAGVLHRKILIPGRTIPPEHKVTEFTNAVDEFLAKDSEYLVGIHCTHGLNRTGYMVCRYMRDHLGIPAKDAIKKFEKARGYQIERDNYIADLLGLPIPEPDVGSHTDIKPVSNVGAPSSISPLPNEDETVAQNERDRYSRCNKRCKCNNKCNRCNPYNNRYNSRNYGNENRRNNWREQLETYWRKREDNGNYRNKDSYSRSRTSSGSSDSSYTYDFRFDY